MDGAQPVWGAGSLSARFAAARTPALRSRGNTAANRENAIPAVHRRGGFHIRPVYGGAEVREGHAPLLHAVRGRPAKWDCRIRPGERRAGCPHPAAPRGSAGFRGRDKSRPYGQILCFRQTGRPQCLPRFAGEGHGAPAGVRGKAGRADMESAPTWGVCGGVNVPGFESSTVRRRERPPYGAGETRRPTGKMQPPRPLQTNVGDDARTAPAGAFRRPTGPQVRLLGRRSSRGVCGDAGFRGRDKSRPYGQILCFRQAGGPRQGRPGRYGIGPYMGCLRRRECSRF